MVSAERCKLFPPVTTGSASAYIKLDRPQSPCVGSMRFDSSLTERKKTVNYTKVEYTYCEVYVGAFELLP